MNLSNKILLGFFGFIFIYMTAAFTELRMTGTPNIIDDKNSIAETVDISGIRYLVVEDVDQEINVIGSDRSQLEVRSIAGDLLKQLKYNVSGDTLTLSAIQSDKVKTMRISVFLSENALKGMEVNRSVAIVRGLRSALLTISQASANIWMADCRIAKIEADLSRSYLDIAGTNLDTLSANLERSEANVTATVGLFQGSIKDNATLRLVDVRAIQLKKDESSKVNTY